MVSKTHKHHVQGKIAPQYDVVVNANSNGDVCTINNPLPVVNVGSSNNIDLAAGLLTGHSHINKFGFNPAVGTGFEIVSDQSVVAQPYPTTAVTISLISSATTNDAGLNISIQGLDANYAIQEETVTLNAGGSFTTTNTYLRVFRAIVNSTNQGNITIQYNTDPTSIADVIPSDAGQTLMAVYTVPAGKTAYLIKFQGNVEKDTGTIFRLRCRPFGGQFSVKGQYGTFGSSVTYDYPVPLVMTEKTDIEIQVKANGTTGAGAIFDLILIDN